MSLIKDTIHTVHIELSQNANVQFVLINKLIQCIPQEEKFVQITKYRFYLYIIYRFRWSVKTVYFVAYYVFILAI